MAEWTHALKRNPENVYSTLSAVGQLVYDAMAMGTSETESLRVEILRQRRRIYEDELNLQAANVGCPGRSARVGNGPVLTELNEMSASDAQSIVNTFNYDMAIAIANIRQTTPTANRVTYRARLRKWMAKRAGWKNNQIAIWTENSTRARAQQDFYRMNGTLGAATLLPQKAICPVCQGWINRGEVPLQVAINNPAPYHNNCPHLWDINPEKAANCALLWMGE